MFCNQQSSRIKKTPTKQKDPLDLSKMKPQQGSINVRLAHLPNPNQFIDQKITGSLEEYRGATLDAKFALMMRIQWRAVSSKIC